MHLYCRRHPKYRAVRRPAICYFCQLLFDLNGHIGSEIINQGTSAPEVVEIGRAAVERGE